MVKTIVGIDVGGTFTDIAVLEDGRLQVRKPPSTPHDPSLGIMNFGTPAQLNESLHRSGLKC